MVLGIITTSLNIALELVKAFNALSQDNRDQFVKDMLNDAAKRQAVIDQIESWGKGIGTQFDTWSKGLGPWLKSLQ